MTLKKFRRKVKDLKSLMGTTKAEATALAKVSRVVKVKKKRLILRGPNLRVIGTLTLVDGTLTIVLPEGVVIRQEDDSRTLTVVLPKKKDKKETAVDGEKVTG